MDTQAKNEIRKAVIEVVSKELNEALPVVVQALRKEISDYFVALGEARTRFSNLAAKVADIEKSLPASYWARSRDVNEGIN